MPAIGTRVTIAGEPGVFLVSATDRRRYTVNLVPANGGAPHFGIHISAISLLRRYAIPPLLHADLKLIDEILGDKPK